MAQLEENVRVRTDILDALGNTTDAIGKGFAMVSAVLSGLGLLSTYTSRVKITAIDIVVNPKKYELDPLHPYVYAGYDGLNGYTMAGLVVGAMIPFAFGAVTMSAVAQAAQAVVFETRRQFRDDPGIMNRTSKPDYAKCVQIVTQFSIYSLLLPAVVSIFPPLIIGIGFGPHALGGLLSALIVGSFVLGLMMSAAGGAWDNAKKYVEAGNIVDPKTGEKLGKHTDLHKAVVCGDTVGDPFKDTSGPSLNILVKLATNSSVVLARVWQARLDFWWAAIIISVLLIIFLPIYMGFMDRKLASFAANSANDKPRQIEMVEEGKTADAV
jgi:K(+)-stimulated pyrophosphate-energized sodium pump